MKKIMTLLLFLIVTTGFATASISSDTDDDNQGTCRIALQTPRNYNDIPDGEVIPALYTWRSATLECTMMTTEYYPAPGEFVGAVLCAPERVSGEPETNYWNTAKGQRTLKWLATSRAAFQEVM